MKYKHIWGVYFIQHAILIHIKVILRNKALKFIYNKQFRYDRLFIGPSREYLKKIILKLLGMEFALIIKHEVQGDL